MALNQFLLDAPLPFSDDREDERVVRVDDEEELLLLRELPLLPTCLLEVVLRLTLSFWVLFSRFGVFTSFPVSERRIEPKSERRLVWYDLSSRIRKEPL